MNILKLVATSCVQPWVQCWWIHTIIGCTPSTSEQREISWLRRSFPWNESRCLSGIGIYRYAHLNWQACTMSEYAVQVLSMGLAFGTDSERLDGNDNAGGWLSHTSSRWIVKNDLGMDRQASPLCLCPFHPYFLRIFRHGPIRTPCFDHLELSPGGAGASVDRALPSASYMLMSTFISFALEIDIKS